MDDYPRRKRPSKGVLHLPNRPTIVFDTICVKGRIAWLANDGVHRLLREVWLAADAWLVGRYVVMPDHIHLCATPNLDAVEYDRWSQYWKSRLTKAYNRLHGTNGLPAPWQENTFHHRLRADENFEDKWQYIAMNPVRAGLAEKPEAWPYQGVLNPVVWE